MANIAGATAQGEWSAGESFRKKGKKESQAFTSVADNPGTCASWRAPTELRGALIPLDGIRRVLDGRSGILSGFLTAPAWAEFARTGRPCYTQGRFEEAGRDQVGA